MDPNPDFDWGEEKENCRVIEAKVDIDEAKQTFFRCVGSIENAMHCPSLSHKDTCE
jgi:hypothetical protein